MNDFLKAIFHSFLVLFAPLMRFCDVKTKHPSHQMSELCCQTAVRLLHIHDFGVRSQNVELPKPDVIHASSRSRYHSFIQHLLSFNISQSERNDFFLLDFLLFTILNSVLVEV